jgi:hypothetical protein
MNASQLKVLRILWCGLLYGPLLLLCLILSGVLRNLLAVTQLPSLHPILDYVSLGLMVTILPVTFLVRTILLRQEGNAMRAYVVFWAGCEGLCFSALLFTVLSSCSWALELSMIVPLLLHLLTFPKKY